MKQLLFAALLCAAGGQVRAAADSLIIAPATALPRDTVFRAQLLQSLQGFLAAKDADNMNNPFVLPEQLPETCLLLDELKEIEPSGRIKDAHFYKPYLINATVLNDSSAFIQLAYMGIMEQIPELRAQFSLRALRRGQRFYFFSPLRSNTGTWQSQDFGATRVYFKKALNRAHARKYFEMVQAFDKKLGIPATPVSLYCCDDFQEALKITGVDYKLDYNGYAHTALTSVAGPKQISVNGVFTTSFDKVDPHDLWHERLHKVAPARTINKPVDEGTAYLYGGSWGLSWNEIMQRFRTYAAAHPGADWLALYNASTNFDEKAKYPLNVDYVINALVVQQLERKQGFDSVLKLLRCGPKVAGNENYFKSLQELTGVDKTSFNHYVDNLLAASAEGKS